MMHTTIWGRRSRRRFPIPPSDKPTPANPGIIAKTICHSLIAAVATISFTTDTHAAPGLRGEYFGNIALDGTPSIRTDANVDFTWGTASPGLGLAADFFSTRWSGSIEPRFNEEYTFYSVSDDGVRVWVDGNLVIDNWTLHSSTENSGKLTLQAGQKYNVQIEYFENQGQSVARFLWSSASELKAAVPSTQLSTAQDWGMGDVGTVALAGDATYNESTGVFTVDGAGNDIWNTADQFQFVHQPLYGDGEIIARVTSQEATNEWARAGIMIRESLAAGSRHVSLLTTPQHGVITLTRKTADAATTIYDTGSLTPPVWLKIARVGSVFTTSTSTDGVTWTTANIVTLNLSARIEAGLAVCSHNTGALSTATFDKVQVIQGPKSLPDTDGDGIPDAWETANGFNSSLASDATLDTDGDGMSNLDEFAYGTNPRAADSAGTISVELVEGNAYEEEKQDARFRITRTGAVCPVNVSISLTGRAVRGATIGAAGSDYTAETSARRLLSTSVPLLAGVTSTDVIVKVNPDTLIEYPEDVTITLTPNSVYTLGTSTIATALINDATNIPANERLFVAFLSPQGTARTYASGFATIFLNGSNSIGRVSLSFSGLTSNQTNAYIRYGVPGGVGPELRPTLPIGQVTDQAWNIVPAGTITGQQIIDALYQVGGKYVYLNIGTGTYPVGEVAGNFSLQSGSSTFTPPPAAPPIEALSGDPLTRDVARFLTQATFGPTQAEIQALVNRITTQHGGNRVAGYNAWITEQLALEPTRLLDYVYASDQEEWTRRGTTPTTYTSTTGEPNYHNRRRGWWLLATKAPDQLRQRVAFAMSEIFVISEREAEIQTRHYGAASYYDMLGAYASGTFRNLLEDVSKSPMMGKYLSHLKNQKAIINSTTGQVIVSPDENYAREIMQLFSIGLVQRHPDGSLKLGSNGQPIPTYTNNDITELARVFTGWSFSKTTGSLATGYPTVDNTNFNAGNGPKYFQASWLNPMKNFPTYHDTAAKTVLGSNIAAGLDGEADLDAALNIIAGHPNVAPFLSRLLIQRLVASNPSAGYVYRVSQAFTSSGGNLGTVVRTILTDYEARGTTVLDDVGYGKQKEPIIRYVQVLRALGGASLLPLADLSAAGYPATQLAHFPAGTTRYRYPGTNTPLGQTPQAAPTVFNWFLPDFNAGGAIAAAGLAAPEMQLATETSVVAAINYEYTIAFGDTGQSVDSLFYPAPGVPAANANDDNVRIDRTPLVTMYDQAIAGGSTVTQATTTVLNHLDVLLCSGNLRARYETAPTPNPRSAILEATTTLAAATTTVNRVKELIYLVTTSPEFLHQK